MESSERQPSMSPLLLLLLSQPSVSRLAVILDLGRKPIGVNTTRLGNPHINYSESGGRSLQFRVWDLLPLGRAGGKEQSSCGSTKSFSVAAARDVASLQAERNDVRALRELRREVFVSSSLSEHEVFALLGFSPVALCVGLSYYRN
ncbi:unnamed protein product [Bubo scandiacus]